MNQLTTFNFRDNGLRTIQINGDPWFCGSDIITFLEIANNGNAYTRLDASEKSNIRRTDIGLTPGKNMIFVSESGLYKLIMRSDKPAARAFQDWVTRDVLPTIRKTGAYAAPNASPEARITSTFPAIDPDMHGEREDAAPLHTTTLSTTNKSRPHRA